LKKILEKLNSLSRVQRKKGHKNRTLVAITLSLTLSNSQVGFVRAWTVLSSSSGGLTHRPETGSNSGRGSTWISSVLQLRFARFFVDFDRNTFSYHCNTKLSSIKPQNIIFKEKFVKPINNYFSLISSSIIVENTRNIWH
jgi:hypothetical protein